MPLRCRWPAVDRPLHAAATTLAPAHRRHGDGSPRPRVDTDTARPTRTRAGRHTSDTTSTDSAPPIQPRPIRRLEPAEPPRSTRSRSGYSAWPGWFPLAVAEQAGIFEQVGLDVELVYFADYIASIDAMAAGELDFVTQTLNDTMASVAFGSEQVIVVVNDNSTGNDKIICDGSIGSIEDMAGKTVAAEAGVVDHFLLVQGLESVGMTEEDIDFRGVLTDAAAAGFAAGEFDCVGVFAPFWLTALERPGSHEVFSSADFPGLIPDHIVATRDIVDEQPASGPEAGRRLVPDPRLHGGEPRGGDRDHGRAVAETSVEEYESVRRGHHAVQRRGGARRLQARRRHHVAQYTAELINPFLVDSGFTENEAPLEGLFDASFTQDYVDRMGD